MSPKSPERPPALSHLTAAGSRVVQAREAVQQALSIHAEAISEYIGTMFTTVDQELAASAEFDQDSTNPPPPGSPAAGASTFSSFLQDTSINTTLGALLDDPTVTSSVSLSKHAAARHLEREVIFRQLQNASLKATESFEATMDAFETVITSAETISCFPPHTGVLYVARGVPFVIPRDKVECYPLSPLCAYSHPQAGKRRHPPVLSALPGEGRRGKKSMLGRVEVVLDRDPGLFGSVAEYLRTGRVNTDHQRATLAMEARRLGVHDLERELWLPKDAVEQLTSWGKKDLCVGGQREAHLAECPIDVHLLMGVIQVNCLTRLDLTRSNIDYSGARGLSVVLRGDTTLRVLVLDGNRGLSDDGIELIAKSLKRNRTLWKLSCGDAGISCTGAVALAQAQALNGFLRQIILDQNVIGDEGASAFAEALMAASSSLTVLSLSHNVVGDPGAIALAEALGSECAAGRGVGRKPPKALPNTCLERLWLAGNRIREEGVIALTRGVLANVELGGSLRHMSISGNPTSGGSISRLQEAAGSVVVMT